MDSLFDFLEILVISVAALIALFFILLILVSFMPKQNPLRQILSLLIARIGLTAGAGIIAIPIEPIPGIDVVYDIAIPLFLAYYWFSFLRSAAEILRGQPLPLGRHGNDRSIHGNGHRIYD